jgi:hypothetical protein
VVLQVWSELKLLPCTRCAWMIALPIALVSDSPMDGAVMLTRTRPGCRLRGSAAQAQSESFNSTARLCL